MLGLFDGVAVAVEAGGGFHFQFAGVDVSFHQASRFQDEFVRYMYVSFQRAFQYGRGGSHLSRHLSLGAHHHCFVACDVSFDGSVYAQASFHVHRSFQDGAYGYGGQFQGLGCGAELLFVVVLLLAKHSMDDV